MAIILGIDPGSRITGFGLVNTNGSKLEYVHCGCIRTASESLPERLRQIFNELGQVIETYSPQQVAIEQVFVGRSAGSALKLGQARGSAMVACLSHGLEVEEYSARQVKLALVGRGAAEKTQVQHMVKALLGLAGPLQEDAADGLAVAICHANTRATLVRMAGARGFRHRRLRH